MGHLDFDIVSDLVLRISDFASLGTSTSVENPLQIAPFMQNKPNFLESQMNVNTDITVDYEKRTLGERGKNKPNSNPIKPNLVRRRRIAKMNVNSLITKDYERNDAFAVPENKPNSNPIKANSKPIKANKMPKQTQFKPNQTQS